MKNNEKSSDALREGKGNKELNTKEMRMVLGGDLSHYRGFGCDICRNYLPGGNVPLHNH